MRCLRAENATAGSEPIGDVPVPGAGFRVELGVWVILGVVAVVSWVL
jgi:hypothetical protein